MRVLFIIHQFFPEFTGGTEAVTLGIAKALQRSGNTVRVLSCSMRNITLTGTPSASLPGAMDTTHEGVPTTLLQRSHLPVTADFSLDVAPELVSNLKKWYEAERFDVIHCTHSMRMVGALVAANELGIPIVFTLTDFFLPCFRINLVNVGGDLCIGPENGNRCKSTCNVPPWTDKSLIQRNSIARSLLTIAVERVVPSSFVEDKFRVAFPELTFRVIPHGLDVLSRLAVQGAKDIGVLSSEDVFQIAFVGSIVPQKGLHVLIKALAQIPSKNLKLSVAGPFGQDKAYEQEIRSLANRDGRIELLGPLSQREVSQLFLIANLLCLPSQVPESFSLTLREASLFGVPALTSDLGAQAEFVRSTQSGETAVASDADDWAFKLSSIIHDPTRLLKWKANLPIPMRIEEEAFLYESLYRLHTSPF